MNFEKKQQPKPKEVYTVCDKNFREIVLDRDDILEEAATILQNDPNFPDRRGEKGHAIDVLRAKLAIRTALKNHGADGSLTSMQELQLSSDAEEVLDLLK